MSISFGTAIGKRGKIIRGTIDLQVLPTGQIEKLAVVIASGKKLGPTFLITANIHGPELTGIIVIHRLLENINLDDLSGEIVFIPSLNPSGLRAGTRYPQFEAADPNRKWPSCKPKKEEDLSGDWLSHITRQSVELTPTERVWQRLFDEFKKLSPDFHIDLHTYATEALPHSIITPVYYADDKNEAEKLSHRCLSMSDASGLTTIAAARLIHPLTKEIHRTTTAAVTNLLKTSSCTFELGSGYEVQSISRELGIKAVKNVLKWAQMLPGEKEALPEGYFVKTNELHRLFMYPIAPCSGILDVYVEIGKPFKKGDVLGKIRSIDGIVLHEIKAEFDGFILNWMPGIAKYEGEILAFTSAPHRLPMIEKLL